MPGYSALQLGPNAQKMPRKRTIDSREEARNTNRESIEVVRMSRGGQVDGVVGQARGAGGSQKRMDWQQNLPSNSNN